MKIEIIPTGEPLSEAALEETMRKIKAIQDETGVRAVMVPTHIQYLPDGRIRLIARKKK